MSEINQNNESLGDISAYLRGIWRSSINRGNTPVTIGGYSVASSLGWIADRIDAAAKRDAQRIERTVRDAICDYQEMYVHAPNDDAEREIKERAMNANKWLKDHGFEEEKVVFDKEEIPCL